MLFKCGITHNTFDGNSLSTIIKCINVIHSETTWMRFNILLVLNKCVMWSSCMYLVWTEVNKLEMINGHKGGCEITTLTVLCICYYVSALQMGTPYMWRTVNDFVNQHCKTGHCQGDAAWWKYVCNVVQEVLYKGDTVHETTLDKTILVTLYNDTVSRALHVTVYASYLPFSHTVLFVSNSAASPMLSFVMTRLIMSWEPSAVDMASWLNSTK